MKVIDKTPARNTKRNAPAEAPASKAPAGGEARGTRRGGFQGNEGGELKLKCHLRHRWCKIFFILVLIGIKLSGTVLLVAQPTEASQLMRTSVMIANQDVAVDVAEVIVNSTDIAAP